jgi:hypothetical protein
MASIVDGNERSESPTRLSDASLTQEVCENQVLGESATCTAGFFSIEECRDTKIRRAYACTCFFGVVRAHPLAKVCEDE